MRFNLLFTVAAALCLLSSPAFAANKTCIDNNTLQINSTYTIDIGGNITDLDLSKTIPCPLGCTGNECEGVNIGNESLSVWLTYVAGTVFMAMGLFMGIPMAKMGGKDTDFGINMKTVARYMFFFVGLYLVYLAFGMARGMGAAYGMESGILGAVDTTTMVMMLTIVLFLFMFAIEFLFNLLKWYSDNAEIKKWGLEE